MAIRLPVAALGVLALALFSTACSTRFVQQKSTFALNESVLVTSSSFRVEQTWRFRHMSRQKCFIAPLRFALVDDGDAKLSPETELEVRILDSGNHPRKDITVAYGTRRKGNGEEIEDEEHEAACNRIRARPLGDAERYAQGVSSVSLRRERDKLVRVQRAHLARCEDASKRISALTLQLAAAKSAQEKLEAARGPTDPVKADSTEEPGKDVAPADANERAISAILDMRLAELTETRAQLERELALERSAHEAPCRDLSQQNALESEPDFAKAASIRSTKEDGQHQIDLVLALAFSSELHSGDLVEVSITPVLERAVPQGESAPSRTTLLFRVTRENDWIGFPVGVGAIAGFLVLVGVIGL